MTDYIALLLAEQEAEARAQKEKEELGLEWEDGPLTIAREKKAAGELDDALRAAEAEQWDRTAERGRAGSARTAEAVPALDWSLAESQPERERTQENDGDDGREVLRRQERQEKMPLLREAERALLTGERALDRTALGVLLDRMEAQGRANWEMEELPADRAGSSAVLLERMARESGQAEYGEMERGNPVLEQGSSMELTLEGRTAGWLDQAARRSLTPLPQAMGETRVVTLEQPGREMSGGAMLEAERLDRIFRRDARRFDGGMQLL